MKTLRIQFPVKTFALYILLALFLLGLVESVLRLDAVTSRLPAPSFGSDQHQFEIQLTRIQSAYNEQGSIDCLFVGDSLVWLDLDPITFSEGYRDKSGNEISCSNFGIAALSAAGVSEITRILVQEYNPKLVIYGLHANSLVVSKENEDTRIVLDTPWVQYKSGKYNILGWLYENSYFVRYLPIMNRLMMFDREALQNETGSEPYQLLGFDPKDGQRIDPSIPPSQNNPADIKGFEKYYRYQIYPENITGIQSIAGLADSDTQIFMVLMPVNQSFYMFFENGEQDYLEIAETLQETLIETNVVFIEADNNILIQESDWWDYSHLNRTGASKFSYWLGEMVAAGLLDE